jgi:DNA primase
VGTTARGPGRGCAQGTGHALERVDRPLELLRAPSGIFGEPPGLYPDDVVAATRHYVRIDHDKVVEGTNHYSIVRGARGAAAVAAHRC